MKPVRLQMDSLNALLEKTVNPKVEEVKCVIFYIFSSFLEAF